MEARERAVEIVRGFYEQESTEAAERWATDAIADHITAAQREAVANYQAFIRDYGRDNGYARVACDRLVQLGDSLINQYE